MPERDFELYLSLLTRFLRLDPAQREQIADELRDHFEERFEELLESGLSREEAIRATLDEFGDAAGLAADFSHIGNRRRRIIMRCTLGTAAGLVAAVFLAATFWQVPAPVLGPARAVAQQPAAAPDEITPKTKAVLKVSGKSAVEAKLDERRVPQLDFVEVPLKDALEFLSDASEVDILLNHHALQAVGVTPDLPITLQVKRTSLTARTALELVLEQASVELGFIVRDGLIYITKVVGKPSDDEIQVYNVRDILMSLPIATAANPFAAGVEGSGGSPGGGASSVPTPAGGALLHVITSTIYPNTWDEVGGNGSLAEFNGLLIIKQSQTVHHEITRLLEMMRDVDQRDPQRFPRR